MKPHLLAPSLLLALSAWALPAHAVGRLADVTVIDRATGATLPLYHHRGDYWVAGRYGARYAIAVRNKLGERVLAVTAVDGVNVLSGETAAWDQTGYVFAPWQQYQVTGWRKNSSEVAAFEFSALGDSYAGRTGRPVNVGVIGVALFQERLPEPVAQAPAYSSPSRSEREADAPARLRSLPSAPAAPAAEHWPPANPSRQTASAAALKHLRLPRRKVSREDRSPPRFRPPSWAPATAPAKARWCRTPASRACRPSPTR